MGSAALNGKGSDRPDLRGSSVRTSRSDLYRVARPLLFSNAEATPDKAAGAAIARTAGAS